MNSVRYVGIAFVCGVCSTALPGIRLSWNFAKMYLSVRSALARGRHAGGTVLRFKRKNDCGLDTCSAHEGPGPESVGHVHDGCAVAFGGYRWCKTLTMAITPFVTWIGIQEGLARVVSVGHVGGVLPLLRGVPLRIGLNGEERQLGRAGSDG
jgi:hypothetical protein